MVYNVIINNPRLGIETLVDQIVSINSIIAKELAYKYHKKEIIEDNCEIIIKEELV